MVKLATKRKPKSNPKRRKLARGWHEVDIKLLDYAPWNYKTDDEEKARKLQNNIDRNGQVESIIIRDMGTGRFEVVNGNHRLTAFTNAGIDKPMCFNTSVTSERAAQRLALETNETKFDNDPIKLGQIASGLLEEFEKKDLLETLPYDEPEFDSYAEMDSWDDNDEETGAGSDNGDSESSYTGDGVVPVSKLLQSLGVGQCTADEAAMISEAVLRERMELKTKISDKDNTPSFVSIMQKFIARTDAEHKETEKATRKGGRRATRKRK